MISVCIATYNGARYIKQQLESILPQLAPTDEVVLSDDASTDNTLEIVASLNDPRIRVLRHVKTPAKFTIDYATHNFGHALSHAKGDYIFLSDQDDVWMPNKVEKMMVCLQDNDLVMSDCTTTDSDLNVVNTSYYGAERPFRPSILHNLLKPAFLGSCMAFRRTVMDKFLPFPKCGVGHDLWIGLVGLKHYRFKFVDEPLMYYRRHSATVTDGGKANSTSLWFKISYRLYVLHSMLTRL